LRRDLSAVWKSNDTQATIPLVTVSTTEPTVPSQQPHVAPARKTSALGLLRRRSLWLPTWRGWLLLVFLLCGLGAALLLGVHPFLAVTDSRPGGILVLEGWTSDFVVRRATLEYDKGGYQGFYVTGGPVEKGAPLFEYKDFATAGAAAICAERPDLKDVVVPVPGPGVRDDRTYASACALRDWLAAHGKPVSRLNLVSFGTHARRSRYYFRKAFGSQVDAGVIAVQDDSYEPKRWWTTSYGFRVVTGEIIAYVYTFVDGL
jgi:hypothetical protein